MAAKPLLDGEPRLGHHDPAAGTTVAIFDLDRTLLAGSSLLPFASELARSGLLSRRTVASAAVRDARFRRRGASDATVDSVRRGVSRLASGRAYEPIARTARRVGSQLVDSMPAAARLLVDRHLQAGDFCIVLSASPQELVEAVVGALGAHRAVGTRAEVVAGRLTGQLEGPFCYGTGKLERLRTELGVFDLDSASAYADSMSDLPLLTLVGHPTAVNPDRKLRRVAQARHWPVLQF